MLHLVIMHTFLSWQITVLKSEQNHKHHKTSNMCSLNSHYSSVKLDACSNLHVSPIHIYIHCVYWVWVSKYTNGIYYLYLFSKSLHHKVFINHIDTSVLFELHDLTNSREQSPSWEAILLKKFLGCCETWRLTAVFTS